MKASDESADELRAQRDEALAAAEAKSAFLATMSHEIRTPLHAVIGMTDLLLDTDLDAVQREFVEILRSSADALAVITDEILDFSKIEAGEVELEIRPFDIRECVESALLLFAQASAVKGLSLVARVDPGCPERAIGDVTRFRQVIINLVANAVKFTERGEVTVTVTADQLGEGSGGRVGLRVRVRDTGIGIAPEQLERLFTPYRQADPATTRSHGGTGLGLVIARRFAQAMGGTVEVESRQGTGSTFTFSAQLLRAPEAGHAAREGQLLVGYAALLVVSNASEAAALADVLRRWGMACEVAAAPEQALALLDGEPRFDVAIVDDEVEGTDSLTLGTALAAGSGSPRLVLLSRVHARFGDRHRELFEARLNRPVRSGRALEAVRQALGLASLAEAPLAGQEPAGPDRRLRLLLAEDNAVNQKVGALLLRKLGHTVDVAASGDETVEAVHRQAYDVVLMDMQMPGMDGLEATRRIRQGQPQGGQPHIVALTASVRVEDREACAGAGMDGYLTKPVREADLRRALAQVALVDEPVDAAVLDDLLAAIGGDITALRRELIEAYLKLGEAQVPAIRTGLERGDLSGVATAAHALRSGSAQLGARRLAALLTRLEDQARAGDPGADETFRLVLAEHARVCSRLAS